jgi:hypothetical protein
MKMEPYTDGSRAFRLRRRIASGDGTYIFPAGMYVRGKKETDRDTYEIWPPCNTGAYIVGIYRRELRPVGRKKPAARKE